MMFVEEQSGGPDFMIHAVIMAGGSGTRFWPESRRNRPKQLLAIDGDRTMIRATVERILPIVPFGRMMVVTGVAHADLVRDQLPELPAELVVVEPQGRNTAPCIALAAYKLKKINPTGIMAVLPADHLIGREKAFLEALSVGAAAARSGHHLLTFGIVPDRPETGFGYVKLGSAYNKLGSSTIFKVERFVEKPDRATAESYLADGTYMWNSGMFIWSVSAIIEAFQKYLPELSTAMEDITPFLNTSKESDAIARVYENIEAVSIDYGIMERADNVLSIPIDVAWNDVGSWGSLEDVWGKDECGNACKGTVIFCDSAGCIVSSPSKIATIIGTTDLIVVDTPDALMICRKDKAQDVRRLQEILRERGYDRLL